MSRPLKLLHASDLHIGYVAGADYLSAVHGSLSALLGPPSLASEHSLLSRAIGSRLAQVDWLVITGDLSHSGRLADLEEAEKFIHELDRDSRSKATREGRTIALLPGNHDRYKESGPYPGNIESFEKKFSLYWNVGQGLQFKVLSEELRVQAGFVDFSLRESESVNIDMSDPKISAEDIRKFVAMWGQGCAYEDLLSDLCKTSKQLQDEGWRVIWVTHFAPFHPKLKVWQRVTLRLRNEEKLMASADRLGITHIFCGHTHARERYQCGDVEILCSDRSLRDATSPRASFAEVHLDVVDGRLKTVSGELLSRQKDSGGYIARRFL